MWRTVAVFVASCGFSNTVGGDPPNGGVDAPGTMIDAAIDAKPLAACPAPPSGCVKFDCAASTSSCYYYCSSTESWSTAQGRCDDVQGGCLVTLNDAAESACVIAGAGGSSLVYIGLRQPSGAPEPAGGWTWQCGTSMWGPNWKGNEPNNSGFGGEDCAATDAGGWVDVGCGEQFRFVCEVPRPAS